LVVEKNAELARFYQALIQAAGVCAFAEKLRATNRMPSMDVDCVRPLACSRWRLRNLEDLPDQFRELDLVHFRKLLGATRDEIIRLRFSKNPWSPQNGAASSLGIIR
jgi:hypothetical protein